MGYQIVFVPDFHPVREGAINNMDLILFLSLLTAVGISIPIARGLRIWNSLGKSGPWTNSRQAMNDQRF